MQLRTQASHLILSFHDVEVVIAGDEASIACNAQLTGSRGDESIREIRHLHCRLHKHDGEWLFYEFQATKILER